MHDALKNDALQHVMARSAQRSEGSLAAIAPAIETLLDSRSALECARHLSTS